MGCDIYYEFLIDTPYEVKAIIPFLVKNFIMNKLNFVKGFFSYFYGDYNFISFVFSAVNLH